VFRDLDLEFPRDHPHNQGWLRLFRQLPGSPLVRATWDVSRDSYSPRFQRFWKIELGPQ
jgi:hypothetical protein